MIERELDGRLRRRGKEVIRDLENATPAAEDVRRMRDELGELRQLTTALRERLDLLEARTGGTGGPRGHGTSGKATPTARTPGKAKAKPKAKPAPAKKPTRSRR